MCGTEPQKDMEAKIRHLETRIKTLEKSKNYYKAFFEHGLYGAVILDPATLRPIEFNNQVCRQLGYTRDEFAQLELSQIEANETHEETRSHVRKVIEKGFDDFETLQRTKNGEIRNVHVLAQLIKVDDQQVYHCIWRDITKKKLIENALRKSEKHYRLLTENSTDTIWMMDLDGKFLYHSPSVEKLRGYTPAEANQISLEQTLTLESMSIVQRVFQEENDKPMEQRWASRTIELQMYRKDGTAIWTEVSAMAVRDENGIVIGLQGSTRNIDDRKHSESALRESEEKFRSITESAVDFIFIKDKDRKYTFVNKAMETLFNLPAHKIVGKKPEDLFDPDQATVVQEVDDRTFSGESVNETKSLMINGKKHFFNTIQTPLARQDGRVISIMGIVRDVTEQKKAEISLLRSERKWRNILVNTPQIGISLDPKGKIVFANNHFLKLTGWRQDDVIGADWFDMFIPRSVREKIREVFKTVMRQKDTSGFSSYENEILTRSGELRTIAWSNVLTKDTLDQISDVTCLGIDLTERYQYEKALKKSEQRYRDFIENTSEGVYMLALDQPITVDLPVEQQVDALYDRAYIAECNDAFAKMYGLENSQTLIGKRFVDFHGGRQHPVNRLKATQFVASGYRIQNAQTQEKGEDGVVRWFSNATIGIVENGYLWRIWGTQTDITEPKQADKALRESEERLALIMEGSQLGYWDWNIETGDVRRNRRWAEMLGYTLEEVENTVKQWTDLHHPDDAPAALKSIQDHLGGKTDAHRIEYRMLTKDGQYKWILDQARVVKRDPQGNPMRMCGTHTDITERKQAEQEREKLQVQLAQAQKMESVGRLAGGVAHDFNNMLSVIIGHASMALVEVERPSPLYERFDEIRKAAERSADLTRQLLAYARKQTISPKVIDINKTVEGMTWMLQRLIGEDIDLAWLPAENVWPVKIDPSQIDQVLTNLCVNARDSILDVGKITIETQNTEFNERYCSDHPGFLPGEYVLLAVSDNGCGMDAETLNNIFEPFFTTKETGRGTGLGLATVYGVVKQNDGFVNAYSEPGRGTIFKIYLPRYRTKADILSKTSKDLPTERGHETILLVEDEPSILKMTVMMLNSLGYQVVAASTPGEAIRLAREYAGEIQLLLTDVVMPEMNGRDLAKNILSIHPHLKRLFMSGYTANVIAHHGVLDNGVNFIQKPFSRELLAAKVREALDEGKS